MSALLEAFPELNANGMSVSCSPHLPRISPCYLSARAKHNKVLQDGYNPADRGKAIGISRLSDLQLDRKKRRTFDPATPRGQGYKVGYKAYIDETSGIVINFK